MTAVKPARASATLAAGVFSCLGDRLAARAADVALFTESGGGFDQWIAWEGISAGREAGWTARHRPRYADVGVTGSRDHADLLVFDPASGRTLLVEITVVHDWTTNKWIADLDRDTALLRRACGGVAGAGGVGGVGGLQMVVAVALASPIEVNETWRGWLAMSGIWKQPTDLKRQTPLGSVGQMLLRGWVID